MMFVHDMQRRRVKITKSKPSMDRLRILGNNQMYLWITVNKFYLKDSSVYHNIIHFKAQINHESSYPIWRTCEAWRKNKPL